MKSLIILECPSCLNPVTVTMPAKMHVDEDMQAYIYLGCARCRTELKMMIATVAPDPYFFPEEVDTAALLKGESE